MLKVKKQHKKLRMSCFLKTLIECEVGDGCFPLIATTLKACFPSPVGRQLDYLCFQVLRTTPSCCNWAFSNNPGWLCWVFLHSNSFFFVCPVFSQVSEAAWWNIEVQLAASRHWGNRKGIKTFTLWHCWEQMPFDVKAIGSAERNKNLIILIMSDSQICKHTQFNMCAWENFSFSPLIFLTLSLRLSLRLSCLFFWLASYRHSASLFTAE